MRAWATASSPRPLSSSARFCDFSHSPRHSDMAAATSGFVSRAPAAASMRRCRANCRYCSCHAVKPRMIPWFLSRAPAFFVSCSIRSPRSRSARIAACCIAVIRPASAASAASC